MSKKPASRRTDASSPGGERRSIGAPESRVELNHTFASLAALEAVWQKLGDARMAEYQRDLGPFIVPGSNRWDILRAQEI